MATATATAPTPKATKSTPLTEFPGLKISEWKTSPKHPVRRWVTLTLPFSEAIELFNAREYDFSKNAGEQRPLIDSWINQLRKRMEDDQFVPAVWSACLRPSHEKKADWHENGTVTLKVDPKDPISLIDANHRKHAMIKLYRLAEKKGDVVMMDLINQCDITIQIYLEPKRSMENFQALQEGRKVSGDLLAVQKERSNKKKAMAFSVAWSLHNDVNSHLHGKISFGGLTTNMLGYKTATTDGASELSCSLQGGANIAKAFGHDEHWLHTCYVEAWDAIKNGTEQADYMGVSMASVLFPNKYLCPLGHHDGKKGGTTLINGIANMWSYMKAVRGLKEMTKQERDYLAAVVDQVFDFVKEGGLGAPQKRVLMGDFARTYFQPILLADGEKAKSGKVAGSNGLPIQLTNDLMSPSSFGPQKQLDMPQEDILSEEEFEV